MKYSTVLAALLFLKMAVFAQSNHSITLDGLNDFTNATENLGTDNTRTGYVTWDATNIYIGIMSNPMVNVLSNVNIVFDTDPQWNNDSRSGNGLSSGHNWDGGSATYPFHADVAYCFYGAKWGDASVQNPAPGYKYTVNGASWDSATISSGVKIIRKQDSLTEFQIPFSDIGISSGAEFFMLFYAANVPSTSANIFEIWPTGNPTGHHQTLKDFYAFSYSSGFTPNSAKHYSFRETQGSYSIGDNYFGSIYFVPSSATTYYCNALIELGHNLYIGSNATFSMGSNAADLTVDGNVYNHGTLVLSNNATPGELNIKGDFTNSGTITHNNVAVNFTGSENQTFKGSASLYDVVLQNTAGSGGLTINGYLTASNDFTITDGQCVINPGKWLKVDGVLTNNQGNSGLLLKSDNTGTASLIHSTSSVSGTVQRYVTGGDRYHYLSSPISNATINDIKENYIVYEYDETNTDADLDVGWTAIGSSSSMTVGQGYASAFHSATTTSFAGTLNQGNISVTGISYTSSVGTKPPGNPDAEGWHLIGNPYPSAISAKALISGNTNIDGTLYFWDDPGSGSFNRSADYAAYNYTGGTVSSSAASSGSVGVAPNDTVAVGQAFFIRRTSSGGSSISFTDAMRLTKAVSPLFFGHQEPEFPKLRLAVESDGGLYNEILIGFPEDATPGKDRLYDGLKLNGNKYLSFYSLIGEEKYCIQGLPLKDTIIKIPLGIDLAFDDSLSIACTQNSLHTQHASVYLVNKQINKKIPLNEGTQIKAFLRQGSNRGYEIEIIPDEFSSFGEDVSSDLIASTLVNNRVIICKFRDLVDHVTLTDLQGRIVLESAVIGNSASFSVPNLSDGIYILYVKSVKGQLGTTLLILK